MEEVLTPKYWICHDPNTNDVLIDTACKSLMDSTKYYDISHGCFVTDCEAGKIAVGLFEIKLVNL